MPIKCLICDQEFNKLITNTHLKKHNITAKEYVEQYGKDSLSCPEYRKSRSEKMKGENNPNYGKTHDEDTRRRISENRKGIDAWNKGLSLTEEQKIKQSETMKRKYESGEMVNWSKGKTRDPEYRQKISDGVKRYASKNKDELSERGRRAIETIRQRYGNEYINERIERMRERYGDEYVNERIERMKKRYGEEYVNERIERMKGRYGDEYIAARMSRMRSAQTEESKTKSKNALIVANDRKKQKALENLLKFLEDEGIEFIEYNPPYIKGRCKCGNLFEVSRQNFTPSKYKPDYCQFCVPKHRSKMEMEVEQFVRTLDGDIITNDNKIIYPYELDIVSHEYRIAIEFCGLYWHSELLGKGKTYHKEKLDKCRALGYQLIQIFEHEWLYHRDIVKSIIRAKFGKSKVIYARKCTVEKITSSEANVFLKNNHLQGTGRSNVAYGLKHQGELVGVMTMSKSNITRKLTGWEINRMAFKQGINVVGGASKLFKKFVDEYDPERVISFAELRYGEGTVYEKLGFEKEYDSAPNYWYFKTLGGENYLEVKHRFALRKNYKSGIDDPEKTEWENRQEQGWNRIWDCGHAKWVWNK